MDKYWITFSQWHKSSVAAGFEAACGVVRHFKRCAVATFEAMVNRGMLPALGKTSLREVTSSFLGWSSSAQLGSAFQRGTSSPSASPSLSIFSPSFPSQLFQLAPSVDSFYHCFYLLLTFYFVSTVWWSRKPQIVVIWQANRRLLITANAAC